MKPYLAVVAWEDAYHKTTDGIAFTHDELEVIYDPHIVESAGWVVAKTKDVIVMSMFRLTNNEGFRNAMYIPTGMVRKIRRLK